MKLSIKAWSIDVSGYRQYQVVQKLKEVRKATKKWRQTDSISTKSRILSIRQYLKSVQEALDFAATGKKTET